MPDVGIGSNAALGLLAEVVLGGAARLDSPSAFAHMDPPTPWVTWAAALWNASLNQNLLHPATAPTARNIESRVIDWFVPAFGMSGGHMTPGSSIANLTALWAARECAGVTQVIASDSAHLSIAKAAHILGLRFETVPTDATGRLDSEMLPADMSRAALVLTAGTTSSGAIDPLALAGRAAWTHVDAAWAGPLRLSKHAGLLEGIEFADSVAISAHKWLFQPKESAMILFRDVAKANKAISFGGAYLAAPNIGVQGSHGAVATPLLATVLAWGREGLAERIENCMAFANRFAAFVQKQKQLRLYATPASGIVVWRPIDPEVFDAMMSRFPFGSVSITTISGERWFRNVAANPMTDVDLLIEGIEQCLATTSSRYDDFK
ncbi:MAG: pyridoxal phosphate-dependent decarboxylase family protein [Rhodoferax sp.]